MHKTNIFGRTRITKYKSNGPPGCIPERPAKKESKNISTITQEYNILQAISAAGGINPERIRKSGQRTEWTQLDGKIRRQIFRNSSTMDPDEVALQLSEFGITDGRELLEYLQDRRKMELTNREASDYDLLLSELEQTRKERDLLKLQVNESKYYEIKFVQVGKNFRPVRVPISDVPF